MRWQLRRGVLEAPSAEQPGSAWWRACNERLLRDGCEAVARAGGLSAEGASPGIEAWDAFVARPTARTWYRAHNGSIVGAYLDHEDLAALAVPQLALGRLAPVSAPLGDPRVRMTGLFLRLSRVLPEVYPLERDVAFYVDRESPLARLLDYGVITPRLQALYAWSADVLDEPRLLRLVEHGCPCYALPPMREVWQPERPGRGVGVVRKLLPVRT